MTGIRAWKTPKARAIANAPRARSLAREHGPASDRDGEGVHREPDRDQQHRGEVHGRGYWRRSLFAIRSRYSRRSPTPTTTKEAPMIRMMIGVRLSLTTGMLPKK